jgi:ubiquitin-conjugating enzyme E2 O
MYCDRTTAVYPLERLTRLFDGLDQLELVGLGADDHDHEHNHNGQDEYGEAWAMEDGVWHSTTAAVLDEEEDWVDDEGMDVDRDTSDSDSDPDSDGMKIDIPDSGPGPSPPMMSLSSPQDSVPNGQIEQASMVNNAIPDGAGNATGIPQPPLSTNPSPADSRPKADSFPSMQPNEPLTSVVNAPEASVAKDVSGLNEEGTTKDLAWKRFDVLPSAPPDHAFYSKSPAHPGKPFISRLNREYRALSTSLPGSLSLFRRITRLTHAPVVL